MVDRNVKVILSVEDRYSGELKKFSEGMQQASNATNATGQHVDQMAQQNTRAVQSMDTAARATAEFSDRQTSLHSVLGTSRRETVFLEQSLLSLSGVTGTAARGFEALATGIGPVGIAVTAAALSFEYLKGRLEEVEKQAVDTREAIIRAAEGRAQGPQEFETARAKQELANVEANKRKVADEIRDLENQIGVLEAELPARIAKALSMGDTAGAQQMQESLDQLKARLHNARAELDELIQSAHTLSKTPLITPEMIGGLLEFTTETQKSAAAVQMLIDASADAARIGGRSSSPRTFGSDRYESLTPYGGDLSGRSAALDAESRKLAAESERAMTQATNRANALMNSLQSNALRIFDQMQRGGANASNEIAKSFSDAFVSIVSEQAKLNGASNVSLIQLQKEYDTVFAAMSKSEREMLLSVMDTGGDAAQGLIAQLAQIAAAGGSVESQLEAIRAAFAKLNGMTSTMRLNVLTNIRGPAGNNGGGHQQGDEWNFSLGGEANSVYWEYMQQNGFNYDAANAAWQAAHRNELTNNFGITGPGQPNSQTGQVYQYAAGEHTVVSGPRMMLVGERGPERVDITPGTGAGPGGGGTTVNINYSSFTTPNEFDIQQLAQRIRRALRGEL